MRPNGNPIYASNYLKISQLISLKETMKCEGFQNSLLLHKRGTPHKIETFISPIINIKHKHPVGKTLISDWFTNSFKMVVYENIFLISVKIFCPKHDYKNFFWITIMKPFMDQSEVSSPPAG